MSSSDGPLYLKNAPRPYLLTPQQLKMRGIARQCGICKGMSKTSLMTAMKECVGPAMRRQGTVAEGDPTMPHQEAQPG